MATENEIRAKREKECNACRGYGFLLANIDNNGKLEIQRCDDCNVSTTDDAATEAVWKLAKAALDMKDILVLYHDIDGDADIAPEMRNVREGYMLLRGLPKEEK